MQQDFARHNNIQQDNFGCKSKARKNYISIHIFFVGVKHVLKIHMNVAEVIVHPKFGGRRPAFLFQNSFSGLNLTTRT